MGEGEEMLKNILLICYRTMFLTVVFFITSIIAYQVKGLTYNDIAVYSLFFIGIVAFLIHRFCFKRWRLRLEVTTILAWLSISLFLLIAMKVPL